MKTFIYSAILLIAMSSCEDVINPTLPDAEPVVVIDAWLSNEDMPQHIYVNRTQPYFQSDFPAKAGGATVFVEDDEGNRFDFIENDSAYTWVPPAGEVFGVTGRTYSLTVELDGRRYLSSTLMGRAPVIDSVKFSFEESDDFIQQDYYLAEFVAQDFVGTGDTYWIKAYKNGQYLSKPGEINVAFDAGFSRGGNIDGLTFIQPIQEGINPIDEDPDNDNEFLPPYLVGDEVRVEIHSISIPAFFFLNEVIIQTDRQPGFGALFAQPLANVSTNIVVEDPNSTEQVLGFFNVAAVTSGSALLTEEIAAEAQANAAEE